jgi:hypothetical protein
MATCPQTNNTTIIETSVVSYDSTPLPCTDVKVCDDLNTILTKFDNVICSAIDSVNILIEEVTNITEDLMLITEDVETINNQIFICCPICEFTGTADELPECDFIGSATELPTCNFTGNVNQVPDPTTTSTSSTTTTTTTEAPLEDFIINAEGVTEIFPTVSSTTLIYGFRITASLPYYIDWGDGIESFPSGSTNIFHTYSSPYTGPIKILSTDLSSITNFSSETNPHNSQSLWTSTSELEKLDQLDDLRAWPNDGLFITGNVLNLPRTLTEISLQNTDITGSTFNLPRFLTLMAISGSNTISGDTSGFPSTFTSVLDLQGNNTVSGDTSDLPRMLTSSFMVIRGQNTISGDTFDLPSVRQLRISGINEISGTVLNLPRSLIICEIDGDNTISGSISTVPPNIQILLMLGNSAVSGNITTLPSTSRAVRIEGSNTLTGDLFLLPLSIISFTTRFGNNTFSYSSSGRTWASNYTGLTIEPAFGGSWTGFNSTETDNLLNDIQPSFIYTTFSDFIIKCGSTPKRTSASDVAYNALVALIGSGNVVLN